MDGWIARSWNVSSPLDIVLLGGGYFEGVGGDSHALGPVRLERGGLTEPFGASVTLERPLPGVGPEMPVQAGRLEETLVADLAEVGPVVGVLLPVEDDAVPVGEFPIALLALERLPLPVDGHVLG